MPTLYLRHCSHEKRYQTLPSCLHNFNVCIPEWGNLGMRLGTDWLEFNAYKLVDGILHLAYSRKYMKLSSCVGGKTWARKQAEKQTNPPITPPPHSFIFITGINPTASNVIVSEQIPLSTPQLTAGLVIRPQAC